MEHLCLTIRLLEPLFHGRTAAGLEWPPSPFRAFQALVNAAAALNRGGIPADCASALEWLEQQDPPSIVAPVGVPGSSYNVSVPYNGMDVVARAWSRGNVSNVGDATPATHRFMKDGRATLIEGDPTVHYVWRITKSLDVDGHARIIRRLAQEIVRLGWGVDLAVADVAMLDNGEPAQLPGVAWTPGTTGSVDLQVPVAGSFSDLARRHGQFLRRMETGSLVPPDPLEIVGRRAYRQPVQNDRVPCVVAFALQDPTGTRTVAFETARTSLTLAGRLRDAVRRSASDSKWPAERISSFVLGHTSPDRESTHKPVGPSRFAYWPVPSVEPRGASRAAVVGAIRRVVVTSFDPQSSVELEWARSALSGQSLIDERTDRSVALMSGIGEDAVLRHYTATAASWMSVTPVVLPGYDDPRHYRRRLRNTPNAAEQTSLLDRLNRRIDNLLRKAIVQAGVDEFVALRADLQWRSIGFWAGTERADQYGVPDHLKKFSRYHVAITWLDEGGRPLALRGPFCIGPAATTVLDCAPHRSNRHRE
jgi:CRISPR-associated protein Csb2